MKKLLIVSILSFSVLAAGCAKETAPETATTTEATTTEATTTEATATEATTTEAATTEEQTFTLEELAQFNGKDGQPAYIAVEGVVYKVNWENGEHNGAVAGTDVTEVIQSAPHGDAVLKKLEVVGKIVEAK